MDYSVLGKIMIALTNIPQRWGLVLDVIEKMADNNFACELAKFARKEPCWGEGRFDTFFRIREGLWVSDGFRSLVVAKAGSVGQVIATKTTILERGITDAQIEKMLGAGHLFTEGQLCEVLIGMIQSQWGGKVGPLLNNGYANLFYTGSCVVNVNWYAGRGEWYVRAWQRDGRGWYVGVRVFSPATGSK